MAKLQERDDCGVDLTEKILVSGHSRKIITQKPMVFLEWLTAIPRFSGNFISWNSLTAKNGSLEAIFNPTDRGLLHSVRNAIDKKRALGESRALTALRLAAYFGMSPDFWMNLQLRWDLYFAQQAEAEQPAQIQPRAVAV